MRAVYMFCALLMLAFTGVQYNDPDGVLWGLIYLVPSVWALIAAFALACWPSRRSSACCGLAWLPVLSA